MALENSLPVDSAIHLSHNRPQYFYFIFHSNHTLFNNVFLFFAEIKKVAGSTILIMTQELSVYEIFYLEKVFSLAPKFPVKIFVKDFLFS